MAVKHSQQSRKRWKSWLVSGLAFLVALVLAAFLIRRSDPVAVIRSAFRRAGFSDKFISWWIAIAKHETAGFTSRVYLDANNLFGMTKPSQGAYDKGWTTATREVLPYGEHQVIFRNIRDSAADQVLFLTKRFSYPKDFASLLELVTYMKQRGYFTADLDSYYNGVRQWV